MNRKSNKYLVIAVLIAIIGATMYFANKAPTHRVIFATDIVRHGDRTPVHTIPKLSQNWAQHGLGTLTSLGAAQSEELGKKFRKYYVEQMQLLPARYNKNDMIIRSTFYQRTEATTQNIMRGMYPEDRNDIQFIVYPKDQDALLLQHYKTLHALRDKYFFFQTPDNIKQRVQDLSSKIGNTLEANFNSPVDFLHLADVLKVNKIHGIALPEGINTEEAQEIESIRTTLLINRFKAPEVVCQSSNLLSHIQKTMQNFSVNRDGPKYLLYVAHDYNLLSLLGLLSYKLDAVPPYNADIRFELLEGKKSEFFVRVSYNDLPIELCGTKLCTVKQFEEFVNEAMQKKCIALPLETDN